MSHKNFKLAVAAPILAWGLLLASAPARAQEEQPTLSFSADPGNLPSVQRGARDFMAYCSGCHSLKYLRYSRMGDDLGISQDQLKANLILNGGKVGDAVTSAMPGAQAEQWFGRQPPDLTLEAKARGADWLYSYLMGFYLDSSRPMGVNNLFLPNVAMPDVLGELQGWQVKPEKPEEPTKAGDEDEDKLPLKLVQQGSMSPKEYSDFVTDLTNFLAYAAEPVASERVGLGGKVLAYLVLLLILTYLLKKEFWRDVH
jgi:ubiquinol-cytochrome c reductase cytochrome c1 subunit